MACGLLVGALAAGAWNARKAAERSTHAEAQTAALRLEIQKAARQIAGLESAQAALLAQLDHKSRDAFLVAQRGAESSSAVTELAAAHRADLAKLDELQGQLKALLSDLESARADARSLNAQRVDLEAKFQDNAAKLQDSTAKLQESTRSSSQLADQVRKMTQLEARLQDLTRHSQEQQATLLRQERLLATDRDIRDLMGARNLHIIDAADNTAGRQEPWFGRVFYTEGKSLVFYAFDLDQQKNRKGAAAFQVWGEKQGVKARARNLGVFYLDQKTQDRWILRFEDPDVLAQIDRIYVTVEPPGGSANPHGKELLATNLALPANHP
jgi:hypothetical protein